MTEWSPCGRVVERLTGYDMNDHSQCVAQAEQLQTVACKDLDFLAGVNRSALCPNVAENFLWGK